MVVLPTPPFPEKKILMEFSLNEGTTATSRRFEPLKDEMVLEINHDLFEEHRAAEARRAAQRRIVDVHAEEGPAGGGALGADGMKESLMFGFSSLFRYWTATKRGTPSGGCRPGLARGHTRRTAPQRTALVPPGLEADRIERGRKGIPE